MEMAHFVLVSRHGSDVAGCAPPSERSARRIARPILSVLASDATPRCASMASADRQMIGGATLGRRCQSPRYPAGASAVCAPPRQETHRFHFVPPFPGRRTGRPHHDP
ncbi:hypothetical protein Veis_1717 [Verminephrobacter eiseniae EF01-2]|uniref:Uncharacterized protein n=1 Tax=Verminephrobacter eiseniae (strain EF01-2) TaxID=391735 RepID=A1WIL5_VEREI|nr:hypothetical protein Veis_1717 [Verminephrobacter eiseniae EF01-2]